MKLKTLKDFERFQFDEPSGISPDDLKQEAVKWIKSLRMPHVKIENGGVNSDVWDTDTKRLIRNSQATILSDFFNITGEDLGY